MNNLKLYQVVLFFALLALTFCIFTPIISAKYARIDDHVMLRNPKKKALKDISFNNVIEIFTSSHEGLYHPMVNLSYSIEKTFFGFVPEIFHFDNLMLHIINTALVFIIFINLLKNFWLTFIITALFAIHPTRAEVVCWITARKDLLYSLFYLSSMFFYIKTYESKKTGIFITISVTCFMLACFSKAMAITLPFVLFLIDFYTNNINKKRITIHSIYVFVSIIFIVLAINIHYSSDYIKYNFTIFNHFVNFINAHFNILFYFDKFFLPIKLYCMYPYFYDMKATLPPLYILYSPAILYLIFYIVFLSLKKTKIIFFGFMFFFITIFPTTGFLDIGSFAVADRYTYIPYLGLFFILTTAILYFYNITNKYCRIIILLLCFTTFTTLCYLTYNRTLDWQQTRYMAPREMKYYKFGFKNIPKLKKATYNHYSNVTKFYYY